MRVVAAQKRGNTILLRDNPSPSGKKLGSHPHPEKRDAILLTAPEQVATHAAKGGKVAP